MNAYNDELRVQILVIPASDLSLPARHMPLAYDRAGYVPLIATSVDSKRLPPLQKIGEEEISQILDLFGLKGNDYQTPRGHAFRELAERTSKGNRNSKPPRANPSVEAKIHEMRRKYSRTIDSVG